MQHARDNSEPTTLFEQNYLHELALAAEFQRAVLPEIINVDYLNIAIRFEPVDLVSGDVYDFKLNREKELAIFVGDATGHGVAAALLTMMLHIAIDTLTPNLPTDVSMRKLNSLIASRHTHRSVSGVFFRISPGGLLTVTHAGHPSIIILPGDGETPLQFQQAGCPLGMFDDEPVSYVEEHYQLCPGDKVVAYTDGLIEWRNLEGESYGTDSLNDLLYLNRALNVEALTQLIYQEAKDFAQGQSQKDDLTILVTEYR